MKIHFENKVHDVQLLEGYSGDFMARNMWVVGNEFGPTHLVLDMEEAGEALEVYYDSLAPIPEEEVWEAYGFDSLAEWKGWNEDMSAESRGLLPGYEWQTEFKACESGIVWIGHHVWIRKVRLDMLTLSGA